LGHRLWALGVVGWGLAFGFLSHGLGYAGPLRIGLAPSAEKLRLMCPEGTVVKGGVLAGTGEVALGGGQWLLVGSGRAIVTSPKTEFSVVSSEADRDLILKAAEQLRKRGENAYLEERESGTILCVSGLAEEEEAEKVKKGLPAELRDGAEVVVEREWAVSGNLALGKKDERVLLVPAAGKEASAGASKGFRAGWVCGSGPSVEAGHGVFRGEMEICRVEGGLRLVNLVGMEDYLKGVVPYEMPWRFAPEALKAQAIAARTYALESIARHRKDGFDLCAGQHCQVYGGMEAESEATSRAVEETRGLVMRQGEKLVPAFFHSTCGGYTEDAASVWKGAESSLRGTTDCSAGEPADAMDKEEGASHFLNEPPDAFCSHSPLFRWKRTYSREELQERLGSGLGDLVSIRVKSRTRTGRVSQLAVKGTKGEKVFGGQEIRSLFGERPSKGLPSTFFSVSEVRSDSTGSKGGDQVDSFVFTGAGWGHGVGMCQYGADGMARRGYDFKGILSHYYGRFDLRDMNATP